MRRSPFYAYPDFPHSFYTPPTEASYHHPHRPFPPTPPTPTPRSVINIPVFDSAPSWPSSSPPQPRPIDPCPPPALDSPAVPLSDPSSAATTIQSHFRGFCVRRHHPLLNLRSVAKARKQLEELQSELESPGFALKMRASEKERLRFSENIMAIILHLDAIEGSIAYVRSQRKEATKIAIKLQDALDAMMMQKILFMPTDGPSSDAGVVPDDDVALCEQSEEPLCPDLNMVQGGGHTISEGGITDVNATQEEYSEIDVTDNCMPNLDKDYVMDMVGNVTPLHPAKVFESAPQVTDAEAMHEADQDMSHVTGENAGSDATHSAEEEVNNGIDTSHLEAHKNHMQNEAVAKADQDTSVDDKIVASHDSAKVESSDGPYTCVDVVQEVKEGLSQDVKLCPGNCPSDSKESPTLHRHGYEKCSDEDRENRTDEANSSDEVKVQSSSLSLVGKPSLPDSALIHQLSEDCRQLKLLVGKLLVQNKAQSKVLCALGERLELLEHQHQLECQRNQQNMRAKRKLKKGSKRSVKCHNCE